MPLNPEALFIAEDMSRQFYGRGLREHNSTAHPMIQFGQYVFMPGGDPLSDEQATEIFMLNQMSCVTGNQQKIELNKVAKRHIEHVSTCRYTCERGDSLDVQLAVLSYKFSLPFLNTPPPHDLKNLFHNKDFARRLDDKLNNLPVQDEREPKHFLIGGVLEGIHVSTAVIHAIYQAKKWGSSDERGDFIKNQGLGFLRMMSGGQLNPTFGLLRSLYAETDPSSLRKSFRPDVLSIQTHPTSKKETLCFNTSLMSADEQGLLRHIFTSQYVLDPKTGCPGISVIPYLFEAVAMLYELHESDVLVSEK